jgi:hypothetical protein
MRSNVSVISAAILDFCSRLKCPGDADVYIWHGSPPFELIEISPQRLQCADAGNGGRFGAQHARAEQDWRESPFVSATLASSALKPPSGRSAVWR